LGLEVLLIAELPLLRRSNYSGIPYVSCAESLTVLQTDYKTLLPAFQHVPTRNQRSHKLLYPISTSTRRQLPLKTFRVQEARISSPGSRVPTERYSSEGWVQRYGIDFRNNDGRNALELFTTFALYMACFVFCSLCCVCSFTPFPRNLWHMTLKPEASFTYNLLPRRYHHGPRA
jgi:hypothetical protein